MGWPTFLPRGWEIDNEQLGDVVTITLGLTRERYVITAIHDDGTADLTILTLIEARKA